MNNIALFILILILTFHFEASENIKSKMRKEATEILLTEFEVSILYIYNTLIL